MTVTISLAHGTNSLKESPTNRIREILHGTYDYQNDHIFYDEYTTNDGTEHYQIIFYLGECDQPARTRQLLRDLENLIEDYL